MIILDANILLYTWNEDSRHHGIIKEWLDESFRTHPTIGLPLVSQWAFLRISTNPRLFTAPLTVGQACGVLKTLKHSGAIEVEAGKQHLEIFERLATSSQLVGSKLTDAVLAAIAIEHGASLASTDLDFGRFHGLKWINPLVKG